MTDASTQKPKSPHLDCGESREGDVDEVDKFGPVEYQGLNVDHPDSGRHLVSGYEAARLKSCGERWL
jgi:hypothetical protein